MNEKDEKSCSSCDESIRIRAKKCPHCHSIQTWWDSSKIGQFILRLGAAIFLIFMIAFFYKMFCGVFAPKKDFATYQHDFVITDSKAHFSESKEGPYISVIGRIRNNTSITWEDPHFEAEFFNAAGALIDTISDNNYSLVIPPHSDVAFRVRGAADKPEEQYVTHKVILEWADDARRFF